MFLFSAASWIVACVSDYGMRRNSSVINICVGLLSGDVFVELGLSEFGDGILLCDVFVELGLSEFASGVRLDNVPVEVHGSLVVFEVGQ